MLRHLSKSQGQWPKPGGRLGLVFSGLLYTSKDPILISDAMESSTALSHTWKYWPLKVLLNYYTLMEGRGPTPS